MDNSRKAIEVILLAAAVAILCFILVAGIANIFSLSISDTGALADTFGGITGPILNLAGMVLVYLSLHEQLSANSHEKIKTKREKAFQAAEQATRAAGLEIQAHVNTLRKSRDKIYRYDDAVEEGHSLYGINPDLQKLLLDSQVSTLDSDLTIAAGLLAIAYKLIGNNELSENDKSYCVVLFYNECIKCIEGIVPMRKEPTKLDQRFVQNTNYIFWLRSDFSSFRSSYYNKVLARENADRKSVWD